MRRQILAVDDEQQVLDYLNALLTRKGYSVLTAKDGRQGLHLASHEKTDLILLDIEMGKVDGHQVLKKLKTEPMTRDIPVIMLTGRTGLDDMEEAISHYADKYIMKPFKADDLVEQIEKALHARGGD